MVRAGGRRFKVDFDSTQAESYTEIGFSVSAESVDTPEPATLALAVVGLAGLVVARRRK